MSRPTEMGRMAPLAALSEPPSQGFIESTLLKLFTTRVTVSSIEAIAQVFRLIHLDGAACRGVAWHPGHQIQMQLGGWCKRTYTPMSWDAERGHVRLVAYLPGLGPGSKWVQSLQLGQACSFTGPSRSLDLANLRGPVVLFGDETSLGLAYALSKRVGTLRNVFILLEAHHAESLAEAAQAVGLPSMTAVIQRAADGTHVHDINARLAELGRGFDGLEYVLSGQAQSIQWVTQALKRAGVPASRIRARAYWSIGKRGLE